MIKADDEQLEYHLKAVGAENANISWDTVTKLYLDNVSSDQLFSVDIQLLTFADDNRKLSTQHILRQHITSVITVSALLFFHLL